MDEQYLLEISKFKVAAGAAALYGLYKLYIRRRDKYKEAYKQAKKRCAQIADKNKKDRCIRQSMASFYKQLAQLELDQVRELKKAGASEKKIEKHAKRARFYTELAKVISNPNIPIKEAHNIVSQRLGYHI